MASALALVFGSAGAHGLSAEASWWALLLGAAVSAALVFKLPRESFEHQLSWIKATMLLVFALAAARSFFWLAFWSRGELQVQSPFNLGDFALHLSLVNYLASGVSFWPASPFYFEGALRYPAGADLFNAMLLQIGVTVLRGFVWTGLVGSALTAFFLLRWGGAFGIAALLFNGGLWAFTKFPPDWTPPADSEIEWKNLFLTVFVTQRGFLWALPVGLLLLSRWQRRLDEGLGAVQCWRWVGVEALLFALLPLFHLHTFLFFAGLLSVAFAFAPSPRARMEFFAIGALAFFPATVLVWLVTAGFASGNAIAWHPGWMQGERGFEFWWMNFGITLPLLVWLAWNVIREGSRAARVICAVALAFAIAGVLFRFAPWPWDNIKIFIWCWLSMVPFLWKLVLRPLPLVSRAVILMMLFISGALSLFDGLGPRHAYSLIARWELEAARHVLGEKEGGVLLGERVACAPDYAQPALLLGHPVYFAYPGHLWSHGYAYEAALEEFRRFFEKGAWPSFFPKNRSVPVLWGPREVEFFRIEGVPGDGNFEVVSVSEGFVLFRAYPPNMPKSF
jgi:hypothetical protein